MIVQLAKRGYNRGVDWADESSLTPQHSVIMPTLTLTQTNSIELQSSWL